MDRETHDLLKLIADGTIGDQQLAIRTLAKAILAVHPNHADYPPSADPPQTGKSKGK